MKSIRNFALIIGIIYAAMGILGLLFPGTVQGRGGMGMELSEYGLLFGLFPVNSFSHIFQIAIGVWGVIASRSLSGALPYSRALAIITALGALFGLIPGLSTLFGLMPLYGNLIWFHALTAAFATYYGWGKLTMRHTPAHAHGSSRR